MPDYPIIRVGCSYDPLEDTTYNAPIAPSDRVVKVVYSNRPWLLRDNTKVFATGYSPLWFPENTMDLEKIDRLALGLAIGDNQVIVTNSLLVLRAFQLAKEDNPDRVMFCYVSFPEDGASGNIEFGLSITDDLEAQPVPQVDWEIEQSAEYLAQHNDPNHA